MSAEENKAIVRRVTEEVWNKHDLAALDQLHASNCVYYPVGPEVRGLESVKQFVAGFFTAFPDLHITIDDMVAEGDKAVKRWTFRGTHKGEFGAIAPTGKEVTLKGIDIYRITGGKVVELWASYDMLGLMQQLSVVPPPGEGGE